ncbi:SAM-dependent methyltransferase [Mycobacterium angelicum]|uniref:S-adenosyl-L-methionine-dependent methyltransferase n=1 Tax=Mycobacterium angelicum TaxID=470074 RepID=A0A1W9ZJG7_MYCAN|nr:class I SAM-dependent methyltransferase [Mycobacterium angelicum]MCV7198229.1 class I SAM-dependent methyltransferase [Mycobacterium angelicum]ORA16664.1 SAM-dependent methyltransferase [Mycobacterium angelicum]
MTRTEGDTWDPATGVGMTATFGAAARAVATRKGLIDDPYAEPLVRAAGVEYFTGLVDNVLMSGLIYILTAHARFVDEFLTCAGQAGIRQAVILASGMDTRPYRLRWPPGTTVYEVDQPEVIDFKTEVLRGLGAKLRANRCAVGVDLRQDWLTALRRVGFDAGRPTVWIAENLLVGYLPPDAQDRLLHDVTAVSAPGSRLAADHMPTWTPLQLQEGRAFVDRWRQQGLDVDLARLTYADEFRSVPDFLAAHGWTTTERTLLELLAAVGMTGRKPISEHDLAITPRYVTATRNASG